MDVRNIADSVDGQNMTAPTNKPKNIRFEYDDDEETETIEEVVTESSNLEVDSTMGEPESSLVASDDKTSADYYFDSYSHFVKEMLKDVIRTKTYQNVIYKNSFLFKDKIVLDVGAGTGILSLFCAKVGAKHVYAVCIIKGTPEARPVQVDTRSLSEPKGGPPHSGALIQVECSSMADTAQEIIEHNGFSSVITVLKGKIEEIELPVPQVDVIISEWMGYFLVYENMLNTVLYARNKWLDQDGIVLPDKASLFLTAIEDADYKEDKIEFWNDVYGFDMSCIRKQSIMEPLVDTVNQSQIVTNCQLLKTMDISKMEAGDASFTAPFKLVAERDDYIHALVAYFDVSFTKCHKQMGFSTGPKSRCTHWKQTVLYLEDVLSICQGEALTGTLTVAPNEKNPRDVDITLKYSLKGLHSEGSRTQYYRMR
ncbi:Protein arginine N-methyltransferase 1 [Orobanche gracilis]